MGMAGRGAGAAARTKVTASGRAITVATTNAAGGLAILVGPLGAAAAAIAAAVAAINRMFGPHRDSRSRGASITPTAGFPTADRSNRVTDMHVPRCPVSKCTTDLASSRMNVLLRSRTTAIVRKPTRTAHRCTRIRATPAGRRATAIRVMQTAIRAGQITGLPRHRPIRADPDSRIRIHPTLIALRRRTTLAASNPSAAGSLDPSAAGVHRRTPTMRRGVLAEGVRVSEAEARVLAEGVKVSEAEARVLAEGAKVSGVDTKASAEAAEAVVAKWRILSKRKMKAR